MGLLSGEEENVNQSSDDLALGNNSNAQMVRFSSCLINFPENWADGSLPAHFWAHLTAAAAAAPDAAAATATVEAAAQV